MKNINDELREIAKSGEFGLKIKGLQIPITLKAVDSATRRCLQRIINFSFKRLEDGPDIVYGLVDKDFGLWALSLFLDSPVEQVPQKSLAFSHVGNLRLSELNSYETLLNVEIPREIPPEIYRAGIEKVNEFAIRQNEARAEMMQFYLAGLANDPIFLTSSANDNTPGRVDDRRRRQMIGDSFFMETTESGMPIYVHELLMPEVEPNFDPHAEATVTQGQLVPRFIGHWKTFEEAFFFKGTPIQFGTWAEEISEGSFWIIKSGEQNPDGCFSLPGDGQDNPNRVVVRFCKLGSKPPAVPRSLRPGPPKKTTGDWYFGKITAIPAPKGKSQLKVEALDTAWIEDGLKHSWEWLCSEMEKTGWLDIDIPVQAGGEDSEKDGWLDGQPGTHQPTRNSKTEIKYVNAVMKKTIDERCYVNEVAQECLFIMGLLGYTKTDAYNLFKDLKRKWKDKGQLDTNLLSQFENRRQKQK